MNIPVEDSQWKKAFAHLQDHKPRPGYAQRFWARADGVPVLRPSWKWLPVGAVLVGLLLGLGLGHYRLRSLTSPGSGPSLNHMLAQGSLAEQFANLKAEE